MPDTISPSGIASAQAFGTLSLSRNINFTLVGGIATKEAFGSPVIIPTIPSGRLVTVFIGGVDRTEFVRVEPGISFNSQAGSNATADFVVFSKPGTYRPAVNEEVLIYKGATRLFRGTVEAPIEEWYNGTTGMDVRVRCNDLGVRLGRRIISRWFDTVIIYNAGTLIRELMNTDLADLGISVFAWAGTQQVNPTDLVFDHVPMTDVLKRVLEPENLDWHLDAHNMLHIYSKTSGTVAAPFNFSDNDGRFDSMRVERNRGKFANRVGVRNQQRLPSFWTDTFVGDSSKRYFITTYALNDKPTVLVNGAQKTVIENNAYSPIPHDFSYTAGGNGVFSNPSDAPYTAGDTISVLYLSKLQPVFWAQNAASIASVGLWETVEEIKEPVFDLSRLQEIADGLLLKYLNIPYLVDIETRRDGYAPGQRININTTRPLVPNLDLIIQSVSGHDEQKVHFRYNLRATNEQIQGGGDIVQTLNKIALRTIQPIDRHRVVLVVKLAQDIQGLVNPGLEAITIPGSREIDKDGAIKEVRLRFGSGPVTTTIEINIFKNGVSIFPLTTSSPISQTYLQYAPADARVVAYSFVNTPMLVFDGDIFTVAVVTADSTAKNGTLEIEIQS